MKIKNPILKKIIAISLLGTAGWLIGSSIRPVIVETIGENQPLIIGIGIGLILIAWFLLGDYIKY
jgi:hypothetical protein